MRNGRNGRCCVRVGCPGTRLFLFTSSKLAGLCVCVCGRISFFKHYSLSSFPPFFIIIIWKIPLFPPFPCRPASASSCAQALDFFFFKILLLLRNKKLCVTNSTQVSLSLLGEIYDVSLEARPPFTRLAWIYSRSRCCLWFIFISFPRPLIRPPPPCNRSSTPAPLPTHGAEQLPTRGIPVSTLVENKTLYISFNCFPPFFLLPTKPLPPCSAPARRGRDPHLVRQFSFIYYSPYFVFLSLLLLV